MSSARQAAAAQAIYRHRVQRVAPGHSVPTQDALRAVQETWKGPQHALAAQGPTIPEGIQSARCALQATNALEEIL